MNTTATTTKKGISFIAASAATFAFAACGTEISAPAQEINRPKESPSASAPAQPTRTSTPRQDFRDENGKATPKKRSARRGSTWDPIDRTKDWH